MEIARTRVTLRRGAGGRLLVRPRRGDRGDVTRGRGAKKPGPGGERERDAPTADTDLPTRLAWYASEAFGDVTALFRKRGSFDASSSASSEEAGPASFAEAVDRLREDYDRAYFVTGQMDIPLYQEDCEFADPFVSFRGVSRFKKNLDNLGSFMRDVRLTVTAFDASEADGVVQTKWSFRCELGLPWRPSLSASGGTKHVFNAQNRMVEHVESWDIDPAVALKQLVRPGKRQKKTGGS